MNTGRHIVLALLGLLLITCARSPLPTPSTLRFTADQRPDDDQIEKIIDELLQRMTLAEKAGQMTQVGIQTITPEAIRRYRFGSVLNGGGVWPQNRKDASAADWVAFADLLWNTSMEPSKTGVAIPILWGTDAVHGHNNKVGATVFPHNIGLGAANDPLLVEDIGRMTAREVIATGVDWTFAPVVAVPRDLRWGRTYESFSADPETVAALGQRAVQGLQDDLYRTGIIATAKHYVGDGGTAKGVDQGDLQCDEETLRRIHLPGYVTAIEAGVQTIMVSFNSINGEKMHGHRHLIQNVLKDELGFDGFVISDWNGIAQVPGCGADRCAQAVNAGIDMFMVPFENDWKRFIPNLIEMVQQGEVSMERVDDAVRRILRVKLRAGLFHTPPSQRPLAALEEILGAPAHRERAREAVRKSLVLLKNQDQLLPLHPDTRILVAGRSAHSIANQAGGWSISWQGTNVTNEDFPGGTSILDGIRQAAASVTFDETGQSANPQQHDVAIVVIGESPYAEYTGDIQGGQTLEHASTHPEDLTVLESIQQKGIPIVTVFVSGRPLYIHREINRSNAVIAAWLPGSEGGGVADVLFADRDSNVVFDFTGKLPIFWPASPCQAARDELGPDNRPLFPMGYGLTYASADTVIPSLDVAPWTEYGCTGRHPAEATDRQPMILLGHGADPHWNPWFGDPSDWSGAPGVPDASIPNVRVTAEDDPKGRQWAARHLLFSNEGYWAMVGEPRDHIAHFIEGYDVVFDVRVNAPVTHPMFLEITCEYPCIDRVDITEQLKQITVGQWSEIRLPLKQFLKTDFSKVSAPFSLSARGPIDITVANIRWEKPGP